ncbi:helix-turn-helix domain-containing protein [Streptomyces sp. SCL15-4]|uniref:helix-turn-helix domain-containing protein n=1 Tax=Streptomyces sp. SCL15-4 TaxID=2967221 RepID=UPI002966D60F|nr:helix-turn-helix domain-containing protein [Streptomyces sp. SCL15-4]
MVRAAAGAFADHGYAGTSLPGISSRTRVSAGALYFHFTRKDELAKEVEEAAVARVAALADRCRATESSAPARDHHVHMGPRTDHRGPPGRRTGTGRPRASRPHGSHTLDDCEEPVRDADRALLRRAARQVSL